MDTIADCQHLLREAGWAVSESHTDSGGRVEWLVMGANGANVIEARAATQAEAWFEAVEQARALGELGGGQ